MKSGGNSRNWYSVTLVESQQHDSHDWKPVDDLETISCDPSEWATYEYLSMRCCGFLWKLSVCISDNTKLPMKIRMSNIVFNMGSNCVTNMACFAVVRPFLHAPNYRPLVLIINHKSLKLYSFNMDDVNWHGRPHIIDIAWLVRYALDIVGRFRLLTLS